MTSEVIEKFVESKDPNGKLTSIFFKQRSTIHGMFIQGRDYQEMKAKNFWRIVNESRLEEWKKTNDINLTRLFSGNDFAKLK